MWHKLSANYQFNLTGEKLIYFVDDTGEGGGGGGPLVITPYLSDGNTYEYATGHNHWIAAQNWRFANRQAVRVTAGQWAFVEIIVRMENSPGARDGELHMWVNGTKTHQYTNIQWMPPDAARRFRYMSWYPIWGGCCATTAQTQHHYIDHIYMSGTGF
jgi:hypothetical protein